MWMRPHTTSRHNNAAIYVRRTWQRYQRTNLGHIWAARGRNHRTEYGTKYLTTRSKQRSLAAASGTSLHATT